MYQPYQQNLQHPQPQHAPPQQPSQPQQQFQGNYQGNFQQQPQGNFQQQPQQPFYNNFFSDPASSVAAQIAKSSLPNEYIQQNLGSFIPQGNVSYYFQVSNSYVIRKLLLILFPYRRKDWTRATTSTAGDDARVTYATPAADVNAPDLYIPVMSFVTYVLLWAVFQGLQGDFHPQVFGYLASQALACSFVDIAAFKIGLYLLNCSSTGSFWDVVAFSGYKFVPIILALCWKHLIGGGAVVYYLVSAAFAVNYGVFLMRSLKFLLFPPANSAYGSSASNSISNAQRRMRVQFLFVYSIIIQVLIALFMGR